MRATGVHIVFYAEHLQASVFVEELVGAVLVSSYMLLAAVCLR